MNRFYFLFLFIFVAGAKTNAQKKSFVREYTYDASEIDSKASSRLIATEQLRAVLLNELGVYVHSEQLLSTKEIGTSFAQEFIEKISTISAGITKLEIINETWDGRTYWIKASITIDIDDYKSSLAALITNKRVLEENQKLQTSLEDANRELSSLRAELKRLPVTEIQRSNEIKQLYKKNLEQLSVKELYDSALKIKTKAIVTWTSNPAEELKQNAEFQKANEIFNHILQINPDNSDALFNRGQTYQLTGRYTDALNDYNKFIQVVPDYQMAYSNRAHILIQNGNYENACLDFFKAAELRSRHDEKGDGDIIQNIRQYCKPELGKRFGEGNAKRILDLKVEIGMPIDVARVILGKPENIKVLDETNEKERWMYELYDWKGYKTNVRWKGYDFEKGKLAVIR